MKISLNDAGPACEHAQAACIEDRADKKNRCGAHRSGLFVPLIRQDQ